MSIELKGRIESNNAARMEEEILAKLAGQDGAPVILDAAGLDYISSAGLRALLRVRQSHPELKITGVSSQIY